MATVRPGTLQELPYNYERRAAVELLPLPAGLRPECVCLLGSERLAPREQALENADVVVCGGRGCWAGRWRPRVRQSTPTGAKMVHPLVGQGRLGARSSPRCSSSASRGPSSTPPASAGSPFIVDVNKNPGAVMMQIANVGLVADANQACLALIRELKKWLRP